MHTQEGSFPPLDQISTGDRLAIAIRLAGLCQREVARRVGMNRARLGQIVNAHRLSVAPRPLSRSERRRLARVLNIVEGELFA